MKRSENHQVSLKKLEASGRTEPGSGIIGWGISSDEIRKRFFAEGRDALQRYGVTAEDVITHLHNAPPLRQRRLRKHIAEHLSDLCLVVAVCRGHLGAWQDLVAKHELILRQSACAHIEEMQAIIVVRQLLSTVQQDSRLGAVLKNESTGLGSYCGEITLRAWLLERLMAHICRISECHRHRGRPRVTRSLSSVNRLRLGARFVRVDGLSVKQAAKIVGLPERDIRRAASRRRRVGVNLAEISPPTISGQHSAPAN
ncbi:MAG TPA: hypothetical protein ENJ06_05605 [Phycisphaeraceae bacterium]|nr:hypothetical protein [Phycisphaeraceae bacterium]